MSINLYSPWWKEFLKYLGFFILGCFVALWFKGYSGSAPLPQIVKVTVPEVKGKFEAKKPVHKAVVKDYLITEKADIIYRENPINKKLVAENEKLKSDYEKANDSIKKLSFNKAIELNNFSTNFEDENIVLNINGIVQGEVKEITPSYTRKEKKAEVAVKQKETVFRFLAGGAVGLNKELNQASYQLDLNFQNRKGDVISAEYLRIGTQTFGMVGFKKSLINIKK